MKHGGCPASRSATSTRSPTRWRFLQDLATGQPTSPTFRKALATQAVCDAVLDSAEARKWRSMAQV